MGTKPRKTPSLVTRVTLTPSPSFDDIGKRSSRSWKCWKRKKHSKKSRKKAYSVTNGAMSKNEDSISQNPTKSLSDKFDDRSAPTSKINPHLKEYGAPSISEKFNEPASLLELANVKTGDRSGSIDEQFVTPTSSPLPITDEKPWSVTQTSSKASTFDIISKPDTTANDSKLSVIGALDQAPLADEYQEKIRLSVQKLRYHLNKRRIGSHLSNMELHRWMTQRKTISRAVEGIAAHLQWRVEFGADKILQRPLPEQLNKQINTNAFKILPMTELDPDGRPIVLVTPILYLGFFGNCGLHEDAKRYIVYYEEMLSIILDYVGARDFTVFLDLTHCKLKHVDYTLAKQMGELVRHNYPERLGKLYVLNYSYIYSMVWMFVRGWISKKTQEKIKFIDSKSFDMNYTRTFRRVPNTFAWK